MIPRNGIEEPRKPIHVRVCVYVRMYVGRGYGMVERYREEERNENEERESGHPGGNGPLR